MAEPANMQGRSTWNVELAHDGFAGPLAGKYRLGILTNIPEPGTTLGCI